MFVRRALAVALLAGAALTVPTAVAAPAAAPGDVITSRQISAPGFFYARTWTITYTSTSATGTPITVSGTVIVPFGANANTPVVGYAPGTHGLGDQCAPSRHLEAGDETEGLLIHQYATRGFAVAITDYEGIGTPGEHTYIAGRAEGNATLDAVRAALRLPGTGLSAGTKVAIVGYSQGGHASGWAAQLAPTYAPELNIAAYAVGAPPANLRTVADHNDGGDNVGLVMAAGFGLDVTYPELDLAPYLNDEGRAAFADIRDDCTDELSKYAGHSMADYTTEDVLNRPEWTARVEEQNLGGATPRAPVLLYHSNGDEILPVQVSVDLRADWCAGGGDVTFWRTDTGAHFTTAALMSPAVTGWVADRLAGRAPSGNC
ncbi:MAG: prolyl oligopeptidase family serine peptidase [Actinophytocola sp.]|uniref:lipase family protein n=1 Tax=Actinophytocola sp. TaxID=1872138 RepID=UPI001320F4A3|nr:lipase family protein [Actinophytocola sp.]MPZ85046.1 prolyl oligopeptidase family serine peptidase [Actinophytocola sp.]